MFTRTTHNARRTKLVAVDIRELMLDTYRHTLASLDPERLVREALESDPDTTTRLVAIGKAAPAMARGASHALGDQLIDGLVVCDRIEPLPARLTGVVGAHPVADVRSVAAGSAIRSFLDSGATERLLVLVSGGGSAMVEMPIPGLDIERLGEIVARLETAGTPIREINLVRRHLSLIKNGGLGSMSRDRRLATFVLSDVVGGHPEAVASGPTMADGTRPADAAAVLEAWLGAVPDDLRAILERASDNSPLAGEVVVLAGISDVANAAGAHLERAGSNVELWTDSLTGESRDRAVAMISAVSPGSFLVAAGETTVSGAADGAGGRNQEAALAAAIEIEGRAIFFGALATDGRDGPTDAAGGVVDGETTSRIRKSGASPSSCLSRHDSYPALDAAGDLIRTGPTGTNLGDLWIAYGGE